MIEDVKAGRIGELDAKIKADGYAAVAGELGIGEPTLRDIVTEISKPGRDIRDTLPAPVLRADLMDLKDLKEGMELTGTVRNVIDFGAFVDIGVHHDGLVHISEISDRFIKHPGEALSVGETVKVKVIGVDLDKKRINLSIKQASGFKSQLPEKSERKDDRKNAGGKKFDKNARGNDRNGGRNNDRKGGKDFAPRKERSLDDMLAALQNKFNKH